MTLIDCAEKVLSAPCKGGTCTDEMPCARHRALYVKSARLARMREKRNVDVLRAALELMSARPFSPEERAAQAKLDEERKRDARGVESALDVAAALVFPERSMW